MLKPVLLTPLLLCATPAFADEPPPLPAPVREMLEAAIANDNEADIGTVARLASQTNPAAAAEIAAMVNAYKLRKEEARLARLRAATPWALWKGRVEGGGFLSSGTTDEIGISAGFTLTRQGLEWSHKFTGNADYRRANGRTSRERLVASYEPRYQFDPKGFAYGILQYEHDPFLSFDNRYSASAGIGYKLVQEKKVELSVDAGPSVRYVDYTDGLMETRVGVRSSGDFNWKLTPTLTLRQTGSAYIETGVSSLSSLTALDAKIGARVSARLSYNVQYETESLLTLDGLDTLSKLTLVYDF